MKHAAKSIHSINNKPNLIIKSLNLCGYLLSEDIEGKASK